MQIEYQDIRRNILIHRRRYKEREKKNKKKKKQGECRRENFCDSWNLKTH